jgi:hypothetical protein
MEIMMPYLISRVKEKIGFFVHVPKCAGTSTIDFLNKIGCNVHIPSKKYQGHFTLKKTLEICRSDFNEQEIRKFKFLVNIRDAMDWVQSFYRYLLDYPPGSSGCPWEHNNLGKLGVLEYATQMINFIQNDNISLEKEKNHLAWSKLDSYLTVTRDTISGIEDADVIVFTGENINKIPKSIGINSAENISVPVLNTTDKRNVFLEELDGDHEKFKYYEKLLHDVHFSDHPKSVKKVLNEGICSFKLRDFIKDD